MKSTLVTVFIISCILLIIQGSYGYVKGKINLRRQSYANQALIEQGYGNDESVKNQEINF